MPDVPSAARAMEYWAYAKTTAMTAAEQQDLVSWVAAGNSPYSNPCDLADEYGRELDLPAAAKLTSKLASELAAD